MVELISRVSKGSKMDQIYIPKNRPGLNIGSYVLIKPIQESKNEKLKKEELYFYNVKDLEPIKIEIIKKLFIIIEENLENYDNIIITGSFLEKGFNFNDIDILIIIEKKFNEKYLQNITEQKLGIEAHIIPINNNSLIEGLSTDPLYHLMLNNCVAKRRFIYRKKQKLNYKILDLHLLKSKTLIYNFELLSGNEKYNLTRNMIAIMLFLKKKTLTKKSLDKEIIKIFKLSDINDLKNNVLDKINFLKKYKKIYNDLSTKILKHIKDGTK